MTGTPHRKLFRAKLLFEAIRVLDRAEWCLRDEPDESDVLVIREILVRLRSRAQGVAMDAIEGPLERPELEWIAAAIEEKMQRAWADGEPEHRP